jgi:hypothetical protein
MADSVLRPGTYRLTIDIENPCVDRRKKSDWRAAPIISAGSGFVVEALLNDDGKPIGASIISAEAGNDWSYIPSNPRGSLYPLFAAIAPNLVRVNDETRTPAQIAAAIRDAAPDLLAACEAALAWIQDPAGFCQNHVDRVAAACGAAIAKARGE